MEVNISHPWDVSVEQARALQERLAKDISLQNDVAVADVKLIAGVDVAYAKESDELVAAVVVLESEHLTIVEQVTARDHVHFPYIPGLFSFREIPPLLKAFAKLSHQPDIVVCDGQGFAHPRRFGLASHLGLLLDVPTCGCGKKRLIGEFDSVADERGARSELIDHDELVGYALRTQTGIKPVFVSAGHRMTHERACDWILKLTPKYRLPETTRQADHLVNMTLKAQQSA